MEKWRIKTVLTVRKYLLCGSEEFSTFCTIIGKIISKKHGGEKKNANLYTVRVHYASRLRSLGLKGRFACKEFSKIDCSLQFFRIFAHEIASQGDNYE